MIRDRLPAPLLLNAILRTAMRVFISIIAIACTLTTQSARGSHLIVLTENSSTSLSVTYDGSTSGILVSNTNPDEWTVTFSANVELGFFAAWVEPEDINLVNFVGSSIPGGLSNIVRVSSELQFEGLAVADGSTVTNVGIDATDQGSISAIFDDHAPAAEAVPEPSTGTLFILSLITFAVIGGCRFARSA